MPEEKKEVAAPETALPKQEKSKEEIKANLDKAIAESNDELKRIRGDIKKVKDGVVEGEIPEIDLNDPGAKAWDKRIKDSAAPINSQLEKQKEEVRTFALRKFLADKPALSSRPEKLKELMSNYDRLKNSTEQTQEGVLMDLDKAYGATFHEELVSAARNTRVAQAKEDMIAADIAIDRGASSESAEKPTKRQLSPEEQRIVEQWETHGAPKVD